MKKNDIVTKEALDVAEKSKDAALKHYADANDKYTAQVLTPIMRKHVGKCFRYRNSSSSISSWWLYVKIVGVKDGEYETVLIEKTEYGHIAVSRRSQRFYWRVAEANTKTPLGEGYYPIIAVAFAKASRSILKDAALMVNKKGRASGKSF